MASSGATIEAGDVSAASKMTTAPEAGASTGVKIAKGDKIRTTQFNIGEFVVFTEGKGKNLQRHIGQVYKFSDLGNPIIALCYSEGNADIMKNGGYQFDWPEGHAGKCLVTNHVHEYPAKFLHSCQAREPKFPKEMGYYLSHQVVARKGDPVFKLERLPQDHEGLLWFVPK